MSKAWLVGILSTAVVLTGCVGKPHSHPQSAKGIKVEAVAPIQVEAGSLYGVPLGERIRATHLCDGKPITEFSFGTPKWGTIKSYGFGQVTEAGHLRYYPPNNPGEDEVPVVLRAKDGCQKEITLKVQIVKPKAPPSPAQAVSPKISQGARSMISVSKVRLIITSPKPNEQINQRLAPVKGYVQSLPPGTVVNLVVVDPWGQEWPQPETRVRSDNTFEGWVFLGDEKGRGRGDWFEIYASYLGIRSQRIRVQRLP